MNSKATPVSHQVRIDTPDTLTDEVIEHLLKARTILKDSRVQEYLATRPEIRRSLLKGTLQVALQILE